MKTVADNVILFVPLVFTKLKVHYNMPSFLEALIRVRSTTYEQQ